jgi:hypothetical protein
MSEELNKIVSNTTSNHLKLPLELPLIKIKIKAGAADVHQMRQLPAEEPPTRDESNIRCSTKRHR